MPGVVLIALAALLASPEHANSSDARKALSAFGQCVASVSPARSHRLLVQDFRSKTYRDGLRALAADNRDCMVGKGTMRATGLPFAAAVAEALLKAGPEALNIRLAKAASGKTAEVYAPSDALAMCVARSAPNETAALFATAVSSPAEAAAVTALAPTARLCGQKLGVALAIEPFAARSVLATASYRLVAAQTAQ